MTTFSGRYRVVENLGVGGMGVVYRAEDLILRRSVALKFLASPLASDEDYRARFLREARIAASLNHPNTCVVYEVGEADATVDLDHSSGLAAPGTPFIAMELIEGETLATRLQRSGPLTVETALGIAVQVAEGLAEAHSRQIVHRDLKPQNVMITPDERVKIVDFGLAKPIRSIDTGKPVISTSEMISADMGEVAVIGTCAYMSPEQAAGKPLDARSDVFAFGIILYEIVSGRLPFRGDTATETLAKILEADPAPLPPAVSASSPSFERLIGRCLQKKPDERYEDARALLRDLRATGLTPPQRAQKIFPWRMARQRIGEAIAVHPRRLVTPVVVVLALIAGYPFLRGIDGGHGEREQSATTSANPTTFGGRHESGAADAPPGTKPGTEARAQHDGVGHEAQRGQTPLEPSVEPSAVTVPVTVATPGEARGDGRASSTPETLTNSTNRPPPTTGTLTVTSAPRSSVSIDGNLTGLTPLTVGADAGTHEIVLTGPDGLVWRGRVTVAAGQVSSLHRDLKASGGLSVVSDIWTDVSVDGRPPEQTPIHFSRLATGLHSLRVTRKGYVTQVHEIFIDEGKTTIVKISLEKEP